MDALHPILRLAWLSSAMARLLRLPCGSSQAMWSIEHSLRGLACHIISGVPDVEVGSLRMSTTF